MECQLIQQMINALMNAWFAQIRIEMCYFFLVAMWRFVINAPFEWKNVSYAKNSLTKGKRLVLRFLIFLFPLHLIQFKRRHWKDVFYSIDWGLLSMLRKHSISLIPALQPHGSLSKLRLNHEEMCWMPYRDTRKSTFQRMLWRKDW